MEIHLSMAGSGDLTGRLYRQLIDAIDDGRLRDGDQLPPTRNLANRLDISRNTVTAAYERLTAEGLAVGRVGAGTFVCVNNRQSTRKEPAVPSGGVLPRSFWRTLPPPSDEDSRLAFDFRVGIPDPGLFPLATWRRLINQQLRLSTASFVGSRAPAGDERLREAIAHHIGVSRSVRATPADVIVTRGAQQALDLVGRVLIEPGMCVAVEEPGYSPSRMSFQSYGAKVVGVPVGREGMEVSAIPDAARLIYTTPSHQFPLGTRMSWARRRALIAWADKRGAVIVEDDYDSEFRFHDRPLDPLQRLDTSGNVIYIGTFSKTLLPMLRLGFMIAPKSLNKALCAAKKLADWHGDPITERAMARFIDDGLLTLHIRKAHQEYASRRALILDILRRDFTRWLSVVPSVAGLHVTARLISNSEVDLRSILRQARQLGVAVENLSGYCAEQSAQLGLVIGYGAIREPQIVEGLRILHGCFRAFGVAKTAEVTLPSVR